MKENLEKLKNSLQKKVDEGKVLGKMTRGIKGKDFEDLVEYTKFLDDIYSEVRTVDRVRCLLLEIDGEDKLPVCKCCGKGYCLFSKENPNKYFSEVCSKDCGIKYGGTKNRDPERSKKAAEKRKQTFRDRYNVDHISQLDEIKQKKHETAKRNYGSLRSAYHDTMVETIRNKYGVFNVSSLNWVKSKKIKTSRKNWGTDYPWQSEDQKSYIKEKLYEKYGVYNVSQLEDIKLLKEQTVFDNYGIRNPSQSLEVRKKILQSNGVSYETPSGDIILCDGFESKILDIVYDIYKGETIVPQPEIKFEYKEDSKDRVWFPDCIIGGSIVEFKELMTCFMSEGNIINKLLSVYEDDYKSFLIIGDYKNNEFVKLDLYMDITSNNIIWIASSLYGNCDKSIKFLQDNLSNPVIKKE